MSWQTIFTAMLPEHILLVGIMLLLILEISSPKPRGALGLSIVTAVAAALAAAWLHAQGVDVAPFPGHLSVSPGSALAKAFILALGVPVLMLAREDFDEGPFYPLMLSSLYGFCLLLSSDSFLTLFLGLEIMSLPVYTMVLLAYQRPESGEAALKYLVLGGAATALFLMGVSLLYGGSASLGLETFGQALATGNAMAIAAIVLIIIAFFLKAAVVPFHAWAPDAYEGASISVTAYMATIIKAGVVLAALRLFGAAPVKGAMVDLLALLPLISIVWGNLGAIRQTSFRRMIAYSSIAHAGYLFYAFLGDGPGRLQAVVFYLVAYGLMNVLAFASVPRDANDASRDRLEQWRGLFHRDPYGALMIGIAMFSLAGIPPLPGFVAKFLIFKNVIAAGYTLYAVLGLVGSYLGIYFYLRVVQLMFMSAEDAPASATRASPAALAIVASVVCLVPVILISVFPGWVFARF